MQDEKDREAIRKGGKKRIEEMKKAKSGLRRVLIKWKERGLKGCMKGGGN